MCGPRAYQVVVEGDENRVDVEMRQSASKLGRKVPGDAGETTLPLALHLHDWRIGKVVILLAGSLIKCTTCCSFSKLLTCYWDEIARLIFFLQISSAAWSMQGIHKGVHMYQWKEVELCRGNACF